LVFEKNANFFAENWRKSQKIMIITLTPDECEKFAQNVAQPIFLTLTVTVDKNLAKNVVFKKVPKFAEIRPIWQPCVQGQLDQH
jgi:hypothetical protein